MVHAVPVKSCEPSTPVESGFVGGSTCVDRRFVLDNVPRRSFRHIHEVPMSFQRRSSILGSLAALDVRRETCDRRVKVVGIPTENENCCFELFAEHSGRLKKLELASMSRVEVRQRFPGYAGDRLTFDYVAELKAAAGVKPNAYVQVLLVNTATRDAHLVMEHNLKHSLPLMPACVKVHNPVSFRIPEIGAYELRVITSVGNSEPGTEAHLTTDNVAVIDRQGLLATRLVSSNCVGRVKE